MNCAWHSRCIRKHCLLDCSVILLLSILRLVDFVDYWGQEVFTVAFDDAMWQEDLKSLCIWNARMDTSNGSITLPFVFKIESESFRTHICCSTWTFTMNVVAIEIFVEHDDGDVGNGA